MLGLMRKVRNRYQKVGETLFRGHAFIIKVFVFFPSVIIDEVGCVKDLPSL